MPMYEVSTCQNLTATAFTNTPTQVLHSYPLTKQQIQALASSITKLHSTTFTTPSLFVHVSFKSHDASELTYFVAGEHAVSTNRITGMVRTSDKRSKAQFDELAGKIEEAWYVLSIYNCGRHSILMHARHHF